MHELAIFGGEPLVTEAHPQPWPIFDDDARGAVEGLLLSGEIYGFKRGGIIEALEDEISRFHGSVPYVLTHSSGTAALHAAYVALDIAPGDEVILPVYTYVATATPLFLCGAVPVLCDVEADTGNIDPNLLEGLITNKTKAIVVTHLWGHPAEMDIICDIAAKHGLSVVEDCSHAHGSIYKGRPVGTWGDIGIFSMGAAKMVTGGMGGAFMTRNAEFYARALILGHCRGRAGDTLPNEDYRWLSDVGFGGNYRITLTAACLCLAQFRTLRRRINEKHKVLNSISKELIDTAGISVPPTKPYVNRGAWYGYVVRYRKEDVCGLSLDRFFEAASAEGMRLRRPRSIPLHLLPPFQRGRIGLAVADKSGGQRIYSKGDFPVAEAFHENAISFPTKYLHFDCPELIHQYGEGIRKIVKNAGLLVSSGAALRRAQPI